MEASSPSAGKHVPSVPAKQVSGINGFCRKDRVASEGAAFPDCPQPAAIRIRPTRKSAKNLRRIKTPPHHVFSCSTDILTQIELLWTKNVKILVSYTIQIVKVQDEEIIPKIRGSLEAVSLLLQGVEVAQKELPHLEALLLPPLHRVEGGHRCSTSSQTVSRGGSRAGAVSIARSSLASPAPLMAYGERAVVFGDGGVVLHIRSPCRSRRHRLSPSGSPR